MERWLGWLSILSCLGLTGCNLTALTLGLAPSDRDASMPPCVGDDCNCGDFIHQALAQQVLKGPHMRLQGLTGAQSAPKSSLFV